MRMPAIRDLVARHPVPAYFALTFMISWGGALLAIGGAGGMRGTTPSSDPRFPYVMIAMLCGPSVVGILLTTIVYGRRGAARLDHTFGSRYLSATALGVFVGYLTAFRVLMVRVYDHTRSLFLGMLMHASFTASLLILNPGGLSGSHLVIYSFALAASVWIVVAVERSLPLWSQAQTNRSIDAEV